jgi:hypothetical protein
MMASHWGMTPRQSVRAECGRRGYDAVVAGCITILEGKGGDDQLLLALAGPRPTSHGGFARWRPR